MYSALVIHEAGVAMIGSVVRVWFEEQSGEVYETDAIIVEVLDDLAHLNDSRYIRVTTADNDLEWISRNQIIHTVEHQWSDLI